MCSTGCSGEAYGVCADSVSVTSVGAWAAAGGAGNRSAQTRMRSEEAARAARVVVMAGAPS